MKIFQHTAILLSLLCISNTAFMQSIEIPYIDKKALEEIVITLIDEIYDGRLAGSEGFNKAAEFCAHFFMDHEIGVAEPYEYFQTFNIEYNKIVDPLRFYKIFGGDTTRFKLGQDFVARGFSGSGTYDSDVVFAGYGISLPEYGYDDYADIDVNGKVVLIFNGNPHWQLGSNSWPSSSPRYKAQVAYNHGAKGVLLVASQNDRTAKPFGSVATGGIQEHLENVTSLHIAPSVADKLLAVHNTNLERLQYQIDETRRPHSFRLRPNIFKEVHALYKPAVETMNIIGLIEGQDEDLKNEYLIIGAHLDHVGRQGAHLLFPGANDNASGVAVLLHLAEHLARNREQLKRSVVFILFSGEEHGLLGSGHYVENPAVPIEKTVAMFNLDCIGFGDSIRIGNGKSSPTLWSLARDIDSKTDQRSVAQTWSGGGADATPFHQAGIPSLYFVATNSYTHLHLPTDVAETLDLELMAAFTKLIYATAWKVLTGHYEKEEVLF